MPKFTRIIWLLISVTLVVTACSNNNNTPSEASANVAENQTEIHPLFLERGCIACHVVEPGQEEIIGPSMVGVATRSADTITATTYTGQADTVEAYIRESILKPDIYVVEGYTPVMPGTYAASLTEDDLNTLVNYLLSFQ